MPKGTSSGEKIHATVSPPEQPAIKTKDAYVQKKWSAPDRPDEIVPEGHPPTERLPTEYLPATEASSDLPTIKTKEIHVRQPSSSSPQSPAEAITQGKQEFMQAQGQKMAVKRAEARRQNVDRVESHRAPGRKPDKAAMPSAASKQHVSSDTSSGGRLAKQAGYRAEKVAGQAIRDTAVGSKSIAKASKRAVKETGRATRQAAKATSRSAKQAVKTADRTAKATQKTAQAVGKASQRAVQAVRATAKAAATTAKATAKASVAAIKAAVAAAQELIAAIAAGGWVVILIVLVICLAAMLIASPFGIFFSGENAGRTMPEAVAQLNGEFTARIEQIQEDAPHDTLDLDNDGMAEMLSNWNNVLAVYAVRTAMDESSPGSVAVVTDENLSLLREIFWEMNQIIAITESREHTETVTNEAGEEEEVTTTEKILHISVTTKDCWQMADEYSFTDDQRDILTELLKPEYQDMFLALTGSNQNITLSPQEVQQILERLPGGLSEERKQVVMTAYQLLGKVNYFWGGKSLVLGWDSRWGTPKEVWAAGSPSTGTVRPYGLDCSGFVDWVFYNVSGGSYVIGHGGGASAQHSYCSNISWSEAVPGDLAFYPGDSHVGIVCGFDTSGNVQIIHCASGSLNNVVVTGKSGFTTVGRPSYYSE